MAFFGQRNNYLSAFDAGVHDLNPTPDMLHELDLDKLPRDIQEELIHNMFPNSADSPTFVDDVLTQLYGHNNTNTGSLGLSNRRPTYQGLRDPARQPSYERLRSQNDQTSNNWQHLRGILTPETLYQVDCTGLDRQSLEELIRVAHQGQAISPTLMDGYVQSLTYGSSMQNNAFEPVTRKPSHHLQRSSSDSVTLDWSSVSNHSSMNSHFDDQRTAHCRRRAHNPGVNDLASGALRSWHIFETYEENDKLDCKKDIDTMVTYMPQCILNVHELIQMRGLFADPEAALLSLGREFKTTCAGLRRAIEDLRANAEYEIITDEHVVGALTLRGGVFRRRLAVYFPEDMTPLIGPENELYDDVYWQQLSALGEETYHSQDFCMPPRPEGLSPF